MTDSGTSRHTLTPGPARKISETFLNFAAPLLGDLSKGEVPEHRARAALELSFTVWNAVVFADVLNDHRYVDEIRRLTGGTPEAAALTEHLISRKRSLFAEDKRLIGTWELRQTKDGINLRADARDPYSLQRNPE